MREKPEFNYPVERCSTGLPRAAAPRNLGTCLADYRQFRKVSVIAAAIKRHKTIRTKRSMSCYDEID
jgi:hypothetical protein